DAPAEAAPTSALAAEERDLVKRLAEFPDVVAEAVERRGPHAVPTYAIRVADDFHRLYHHHRVLESESQAFRLGLCRATQIVIAAAAMAAGRWVGRGDKISADQAAVDAMRFMLDTVSMSGSVVIGEGEKDEAPMLYNGEDVGNGQGPDVDVAVDPLEGTRLTALGMPNAIAVIAVAERGTMFFPGAAFYMDKIAVGSEAADAIDLEATPTENVRRVAEAKGMQPNEVTVVVLERDRHDALIAELREAGARVNLI